jgi:hypothetical protein
LEREHFVLQGDASERHGFWELVFSKPRTSKADLNRYVVLDFDDAESSQAAGDGALRVYVWAGADDDRAYAREQVSDFTLHPAKIPSKIPAQHDIVKQLLAACAVANGLSRSALKAEYASAASPRVRSIA